MSEPTLQTSHDASELATLWLQSEWAVMGLTYGLKAGVFLLTLIGGWVISGFFGRSVARLIDRLGLEVLAEKLGAARLLYKFGLRGGTASLCGKIARLCGLIITGYAAIAQLEIKALTHALSAALGFLPTLLTAAAIAAGGVWLSDRLRRMILIEEEPSDTRKFLAQVASIATLVMAFTMALEQLGVQMELLHHILLGLYGVVVCSLGVMFALGARESTHQLIAGYYGRKLLKVGDQLRLGDEAGPYEVVAFAPLHIVAARDPLHEALIPYTTLMTRSLRVTYTEPSAPPVRQEANDGLND